MHHALRNVTRAEESDFVLEPMYIARRLAKTTKISIASRNRPNCKINLPVRREHKDEAIKLNKLRERNVQHHI